MGKSNVAFSGRYTRQRGQHQPVANPDTINLWDHGVQFVANRFYINDAALRGDETSSTILKLRSLVLAEV
jgi:hypothetical protein